MSRYVAAIDQGTTSTRRIFDADGQSVGMAQQEHETGLPSAGLGRAPAAGDLGRTEAVIADALATTG
jgi:glycerol kinase